jgi:hypothetical protein
MNMPQSPQSAWTGLRGSSRLVIGSPRVVIPGRFGTAPMYPGDQYGRDGRRARRARRQAAAQEATETVQETPAATENAEAAAPRRWVPRISNPFSNISRPTMPSIHLPGRRRETETNAQENTPSQLEAGVVR